MVCGDFLVPLPSIVFWMGLRWCMMSLEARGIRERDASPGHSGALWSTVDTLEQSGAL